MRDYMSRESTASVNGIFILVVFVSHMKSYVVLPEILRQATTGLGQLMVAMFLFYSGYGVAESIRKKGEAYVRGIPVRRVFKVLWQFALTVLLFAVMDWALGISFTPSQFVLSLFGWENLGNSNWYIFGILCLYLITWIAFSIFGKSRWRSFVAVCVLTALLILALHETKESWWYNTLTAYPFGMLFSMTREKWDEWLEKPAPYLAILAASLAITVLLNRYSTHTSVHLCMTVSYCVFILALTKRVPVYNPALEWMGKHLFEMYMLMRIPMLLLKRGSAAPLREPAYLAGYALFCFLCTLLLAAGYHAFIQRTEHAHQRGQ